ncbi:diacylglycerol kinase family protein [Nonomuraea roseoviolacea subsp. roseoviolacea]|uniref:Diacylglycerol kinase family enzyme n=1 Tax=Nonomuraea roseoviolacea subsp. carminata TaxID=160689 RepID=A0ABT1JQW7_9ACTN|nr:diacylglycerol kinase family protein [Nonomuraea roseoviolacea]MCP2343960.1 diacylglycerol kinase family enzyme [Nonomuraea roseoviolacea subsp. carminata]
MTTDAGAVVVMNPGSGGGKVGRFRLVERAGRYGAAVRLTGPGQGAAWLARQAVEDGVAVLGVAGGDGTVSAVAAVAAEADLPLVVIPAGTRNHFARDLGLDLGDPARALEALGDGEPVRADLGVVNSHVFVNNVSFGIYAEALLEPDYREARARTLAAIAPRYLGGRQWVDASVDTPDESVEHPQVVLVSNNAYHLSTPRYLGRRFTLASGLLGAIVFKRPPGPPPPDLFARLRRDLRRNATTNAAETGIIAWAALQVRLDGPARLLPAGIDGEAVELHLPVTCDIRPGALRLLLPRRRPGVPPS